MSCDISTHMAALSVACMQLCTFTILISDFDSDYLNTTPWSIMSQLIETFQSIGLSEAKAKDTIKNTALSNTLKGLILQVQ